MSNAKRNANGNAKKECHGECQKGMPREMQGMPNGNANYYYPLRCQNLFKFPTNFHKLKLGGASIMIILKFLEN